ncbi:MAG: hypothetical protein GC181_13805 [Bacteroidetes bacterium]|nr:hypothetical protein [Bacteroidota bacterium]
MKPAEIFQLTTTELLLSIANGSIDPVLLAKAELANRGLDSKGTYVGFINADNHFFPEGRPTVEQL